MLLIFYFFIVNIFKLFEIIINIRTKMFMDIRANLIIILVYIVRKRRVVCLRGEGVEKNNNLEISEFLGKFVILKGYIFL